MSDINFQTRYSLHHNCMHWCPCIGNLSIVENRKLRKLLSKGPSYREQNNIKRETNLKILKKAVREYKLKCAKKRKK